MLDPHTFIACNSSSPDARTGRKDARGEQPQAEHLRLVMMAPRTTMMTTMATGKMQAEVAAMETAGMAGTTATTATTAITVTTSAPNTPMGQEETEDDRSDDQMDPRRHLRPRPQEEEEEWEDTTRTTTMTQPRAACDRPREQQRLTASPFTTTPPALIALDRQARQGLRAPRP